MAIKTLSDIKDLKNRNVLVRVDFDVPINEGGQVADATRIEKCLPTMQYLLDKGAKLALVTKIGRPKDNKKTSTKILTPVLEKLLGVEVIWVANPLDPGILKLLSNPAKSILLLENIRFYREEEKADETFAKNLAKPYDLYVNEAFAMCHRNEASVSIVPKFLPSYGGFRLIREVETLTALLKNPQRPFVAVIGGAKLETKLPVIENLAKLADKVLVGGALPFYLSFSHKLLKLPGILVPPDSINCKDIGPQTISMFKAELSKAKTVVWNGPMGVFEDSKYAKGTVEIARYISSLSAFKVVGGGDTISAVTKAGVLEKMDFVSMGGGAMLTLLAEKPMPGLTSLK